jgi:hypothetical protein
VAVVVVPMMALVITADMVVLVLEHWWYKPKDSLSLAYRQTADLVLMRHLSLVVAKAVVVVVLAVVCLFVEIWS